MKSRDWKVTLALVLGLSMLVAITPGCGKNVVGPTAPTLAAEADEMSEAEVLQNYSAACHNPGHWIGPRGWVYEFLMNCTAAKILKMGDDVNDGYFSDPAVKTALKRILTSKLFYLIMFNHGAGFMLVDAAAQIISTGWSPNRWDNPGNFPNKVTLFPFDWNTYRLFHGSILSGWVPAGTGYVLQMTSPEGNYLHLQTGTKDNDIFKNNMNFYEFRWDYTCQLTNSHSAYLNTWMTRNLAANWVYLSGAGSANMMLEDGQGIWFDDIHFSTSDKSGRVHLYAAPDNKIEVLLEFNADGSGTGHMDIKNVRGVLAHYEYSQAADNHGWWTKNNGKKHCY